MSIPDFIFKLLRKLRKVQLPEIQPELEQQNFERLKPYLPTTTLEYIQVLLSKHLVIINVVKGRSSKHGDYRPVPEGQIPTITINNNLNPYSFLITFIHEWAHLLIDEQYRSTVKPHGKEWKEMYRLMLIPLLEMKGLGISFREALESHIKSPKASVLGDANFAKHLKTYDNLEVLHLEDIKEGAIFKLSNGLSLKKGPKRRTRYLCEDLDTKKKYTVHGLAEVETYE